MCCDMWPPLVWQCALVPTSHRCSLRRNEPLLLAVSKGASTELDQPNTMQPKCFQSLWTWKGINQSETTYTVLHPFLHIFQLSTTWSLLPSRQKGDESQKPILSHGGHSPPKPGAHPQGAVSQEKLPTPPEPLLQSLQQRFEEGRVYRWDNWSVE